MPTYIAAWFEGCYENGYIACWASEQNVEWASGQIHWIPFRLLKTATATGVLKTRYFFAYDVAFICRVSSHSQ